MLRRSLYSALAVGLLGGLALSYFIAPRTADASRNGSGTYSLPAGTSVSSGQVITSSWANTLTSDIASELTNSLDRQGRGAMSAPLQCSSGSVGAPSLTFSADTDTGLYRVGVNDLGLTAGGVKIFDCVATGCTEPLTLAVTGAETTAAGITATQSTSNGSAITATGNGTGKGVTATGGSSSGAGILATGGSTNGVGGVFQGTGTGAGATGTGGSSSGAIGLGGTGGSTNGIGVSGAGVGSGVGGSFTGGGSSGDGLSATGGSTNGRGGLFQGAGSGAGVYATGGGTNADGVYGKGGSSNSYGIHGVGTGTGAGGKFEGGGGAAAALVLSGWSASRGAIELSGANPTSVTSFTNSITPVNIIKAWGRMSSNGSGSLTLLNGFNISSVACGGSGNDYFVVTMNTAMTGSDDYAVVASSTPGINWTITHSSATAFTVSSLATCDGSSSTIDFMVVGFQ